MEKYSEFFIALLNGGLIEYEQDIDSEILIAKNRFSITRDVFGLISSLSSQDYIDLKDLLKLNGFHNNLDILLAEVEQSILDKKRYDEDYKKLFYNHKVYGFADLMKLDSDIKYALFNRINTKVEENQNYPLMYFNSLPPKYRLENTLDSDIVFLNVPNDEIDWEGELNPLEAFNGKFPLHPEVWKKSNYKNKKTTKKCYFSASHRTFTFKDFDYFFKLDVPFKVSSSIRTLTRSSQRIKASKLTINHSNVNWDESFNLFVLPDISEMAWKGNNLVLRKKISNIDIIPLFSLFGDSPFLDDRRTFMEWYIEENGLDPLDFVLNKIINPIIKTFFYFIKLSIDSGEERFIQPFNFHRQNLSVALKNNQVTGLVVQDIDMNLDLTPQNISSEFDTCITLFILGPAQELLAKKYNVDKHEFIRKVNSIVTENIDTAEKSWLKHCEVRNKSFFHNTIWKNIQFTTNKKVNKVYTGKINPYRQLNI